VKEKTTNTAEEETVSEGTFLSKPRILVMFVNAGCAGCDDDVFQRDKKTGFVFC
jgi:hypothetical protein